MTLTTVGSVASGEITVHPDGLLSDVDLLCHTSEAVDVAALHDFLVGRLPSKLWVHEEPQVGIGLAAATERDDEGALSKWTRLFWYTCLRAQLMLPPRSSYSYRKGIALGEMLRRSADSYEDARARVVRAIGTADDHDLLGLRCLDEKLNRAPLTPRDAAKEEFLCWTASVDDEPDLAADDHAFRQAILALERGDFRSLTDTASVVGNVLGSDVRGFWSRATDDGDISALWLILVLFRQRRWPQDVQFSHFKYRSYEAVFSGRTRRPPASLGLRSAPVPRS